MKRINLTVMSFALLHLSFATVDQVGQRVGMITDRYSIVSDADLDEEEDRCASPVEPFPSDNLCFNYWQCLPTREVFMDCEDIGPDIPIEHVGMPTLWIKDGENIHEYYTRRMFGMDACHQWLQAWREVIEGEDVVCLSGNFIQKEYTEGDSNMPPGMHSTWVIDRMKSRRGEWSYFYRGPLNEDGSAVE